MLGQFLRMHSWHFKKYEHAQKTPGYFPSTNEFLFTSVISLILKYNTWLYHFFPVIFSHFLPGWVECRWYIRGKPALVERKLLLTLTFSSTSLWVVCFRNKMAKRSRKFLSVHAMLSQGLMFVPYLVVVLLSLI